MTGITHGRGAWPSNGTGGTLNSINSHILPGPYYMLHPNQFQQVGIKAWLLNYVGEKVETSDSAVWHGVLGIQVLVNGLNIPCPIHGVFDSETDRAVRQAQGKLGLVVDGIVGQTTMKHLLLPLIKRTAQEMNQDWKPIYGVLASEGAFDPGAVGFLDPNDLGLAQINIPSHPSVTFSDAFCPSFATKFVAGLIGQALAAFNDERASVAAYNLGVGGTRQWIAAGRPDKWTPPWSSGRERNVKEYIDTILAASDGIA